jgi:hypothetical protein
MTTKKKYPVLKVNTIPGLPNEEVPGFEKHDLIVDSVLEEAKVPLEIMRYM